MQITDYLNSFGFYQRLNPRERVLLLLVAGTAFVLGNLMALSTIARSFRTFRQEYSEKMDNWKFASNFLQDKATWDKRAQWLAKTQTRLTNRDAASYALVDQMQALGRKYQVILTNVKPLAPLPGTEKASPDYQAVTMNFDTRSDWRALVNFMAAVQDKPENFIAFDEARLHSEPSDPATMIASFRVSKWYAAK